MTTSIDRLVQHQVIFREVNERIRELAEQLYLKSGNAFICECSEPKCVESLTLDLDEYKAIRSSPTVFLIAPGHETPEVETVVETNDRFALVEKFRELELVTESYQPISERQA